MNPYLAVLRALPWRQVFAVLGLAAALAWAYAWAHGRGVDAERKRNAPVMAQLEARATRAEAQIAADEIARQARLTEENRIEKLWEQRNAEIQAETEKINQAVAADNANLLHRLRDATAMPSGVAGTGGSGDPGADASCGLDAARRVVFGGIEQDIAGLGASADKCRSAYSALRRQYESLRVRRR